MYKVKLTEDEVAMLLKKIKNLDSYCKREETYHRLREPNRTRGYASRVWAYLHKKNMSRYLDFFNTLKPGVNEIPDAMAAHINDILERECINIMRNMKSLYRDDEVRRRMLKEEEGNLIKAFVLLDKFRDV